MNTTDFHDSTPVQAGSREAIEGIEAPDCYAKRRLTQVGDEHFASLFRGSHYQVKKSLLNASRS